MHSTSDTSEETRRDRGLESLTPADSMIKIGSRKLLQATFWNFLMSGIVGLMAIFFEAPLRAGIRETANTSILGQ